MERARKKNYTPLSWWKITLIILSIFVALTVVVWLVFAFAYPSNFANFNYKIGNYSYSAKLYMRDYAKTNDINSVYMANNLYVKTKNYVQIECTFDELFKHDNYDELVTKVDSDNMSLNTTALVKSTLLNEDAYLKNAYVSALVHQSKWDEAFSFALTYSNTTAPTMSNVGVYLWGNLINSNTSDDVYNKFATTKNADDEYVYDSIVDYYNNLCTAFDTWDNNHQEYIFACGNKIILVGNNLTILNNHLGHSSSNASIVSKISEVNTSLRGLI